MSLQFSVSVLDIPDILLLVLIFYLLSQLVVNRCSSLKLLKRLRMRRCQRMNIRRGMNFSWRNHNPQQQNIVPFLPAFPLPFPSSFPHRTLTPFPTPTSRHLPFPLLYLPLSLTSPRATNSHHRFSPLTHSPTIYLSIRTKKLVSFLFPLSPFSFFSLFSFFLTYIDV